jgi:hypothetical protein
MIDCFYIVTLNRINDQRTYKSIPQSWKDRTKLVVQSQEANKYPSHYNLFVLPDSITTINETREYVIRNNNNIKFGLFDDDLTFTRTRGENEDGPSNIPMTDKDFENLETTICEWFDEGYPHCGLDAVWNPPTRNKLYKTNSRICMNVFFDGSNVPINDINFSRLLFSSDFDVTLQLLRLGKQNRVSLKYRVGQVSTQAKGGCAEYRTIQIHNECMEKLAEYHKGFVKLYEKVESGSGEWKGKTKLAAKISWKKAYQSSQVNTLDEFMS